MEKSTQMIKEGLDKRYGGPWCVGCTAVTSCIAVHPRPGSEQTVGGALGSGSGRANPSPHVMHAACRHVVVGRAFAFEVSHEVRRPAKPCKCVKAAGRRTCMHASSHAQWLQLLGMDGRQVWLLHLPLCAVQALCAHVRGGDDWSAVLEVLNKQRPGGSSATMGQRRPRHVMGAGQR